MIINYFIIISLLFCSSDSNRVVTKNNYFNNLDLKLNLNPRDILPKYAADKYAGVSNAISDNLIDTIKVNAKEYTPSVVSSDDIIVMETSKGVIKLKYFPDIAPKHCYNFKKLANSGFYDETLFHRVIKNFMIQGGDILSRDKDKKNDGQGGPGWSINQEFNNLKHKKGILSMARGPSENSAGSQFFICHKDAPWLDRKYTVFGEVVENIHVIDHIAASPTDYTVIKSSCYKQIPEGEDENYWVQVQDPKTREKLFAKVPIGSKKDNFRQKIINDLRSDNPAIPVIIKKIRVISKEEEK